MFLQAAQLAHILDGRLKELFEDADREKAAREASAKTKKDKTKATENTKKMTAIAEMAKALAKKRSAKFETKQNEADLKLAEVISLNVA